MVTYRVQRDKNDSLRGHFDKISSRELFVRKRNMKMPTVSIYSGLKGKSGTILPGARILVVSSYEFDANTYSKSKNFLLLPSGLAI